MLAILKNPVALAYGQLVVATVINMFTIYCLKKADGFTQLWPSVGVAVSIVMVQCLVSRAMASGVDVGQVMTAVLVMVMIGSILMGFILFGETLSAQKILGYALAVAGVIIAASTKI